MPPKETTFEIYTIAVAVAIVFIRHRFNNNAKESKLEWTVDDLVKEINSLPNSSQFSIDNTAILSQGLYYFQSKLETLCNCSLNQKQANLTPAWGSLPAHLRSYTVSA